jgi:hypothetical protein
VLSEILDSHGGEHKDGCLLGCCSVTTRRPDDGGSKHFETSVNFYQITRGYNPEDSNFQCDEGDCFRKKVFGSCILFLPAGNLNFVIELIFHT